MVVGNPPAGWYPDPQQPERQRYWDGSGWTEQFQPTTFFDATLKIGGVVHAKEKRLVVTSEELSWGDERVRWDEVTGFSHLITVRSGVETMYEISRQCGQRVVHALFQRWKKQDHTPGQAYQAIGVLAREQAWHDGPVERVRGCRGWRSSSDPRSALPREARRRTHVCVPSAGRHAARLDPSTDHRGVRPPLRSSRIRRNPVFNIRTSAARTHPVIIGPARREGSGR